MQDRTKLDDLRDEINVVDKEIVRLFEKRMAISKAVGDYKKVNNLPVFVASREAEVIKTRQSWLSDKELESSVEELFECIMGLSRSLQNDTVSSRDFKSAKPVENPRVAYCGVPGCYAEEAMKNYFAGSQRAVPVSSFAEVFSALDSGEADYGVLPIENTSTGAIDDVLDLLASGGLYVVGQTVIEINHCLLGTADTEISDIKEVYSHAQGLAQSSEFLSTLSGIKQIPISNTALAAKYVSEEKDKTKAAVASAHAGELYSLKVLARGINKKEHNHTRFAIIGKNLEIAEDADTVSIAFTLKHESGTLKRAISRFASAGLNLLHIESRPLKDKNFEYLFYIDFSGNLNDKRVKDALIKVENECVTLTVLGNFSAKK